jgi:hypothetical protein
MMMFRRDNDQSEGDREVAVDVALEQDVRAVEESIDAYLGEPSAERRRQLLEALQQLDQQIDLSDDYESRIAGSAAIGYASKGSVLGETSSASAAEEVPQTELVAQIALIKAAKREVTAPTLATLADLRAANQALTAGRGGPAPGRSVS